MQLATNVNTTNRTIKKIVPESIVVKQSSPRRRGGGGSNIELTRPAPSPSSRGR